MVLENHRFAPLGNHVPANKKAELLIKKRDATADEFDSASLSVEKVIAGKGKGVMHLRALCPGHYPFLGEFNAQKRNRRRGGRLTSAHNQGTAMTLKDGWTLLEDDPGEDESSAGLVVTTYRCAMAGLCFGDTSSWEFSRRLLAKSIPPEEVGPLFGQFYSFGRALLAAAKRPLSCCPVSYSGTSGEEALALHMIETSQRASHFATLTAASTLLGVDDLGAVLQAAQSLASGLARLGIFVRGSRRGFAG